MRDSNWYRVIVCIVLALAIVLRVQFAELSIDHMKFVWPMQIAVLVIFGIMVFGLTKDQKQFKQSAIQKIGYDSVLQKVKVQAFVTIVMFVYLILTLLPLPALSPVSDLARKGDGAALEDISLFVKAWLMFSTVVFCNVFVASKLVKILVQRWLTSW